MQSQSSITVGLRRARSALIFIGECLLLSKSMTEVSVMIPSYNSAKSLTDAVDSVLSQTLRDYEVLVIDDGSTDDTESVMSRYGEPVRYIRQRNRGVGAARNRGIKESGGRYVAFLDADDTWHQDKLRRQV